MKLWLIEMLGEVDYDEHHGAVIRAETEEQARSIAANNLHPRKSERWIFQTSVSGSSCEELLPSGDAGIVLSSFKAGQS